MPKLFERNELSRRWQNVNIAPLYKKMIEIYTVSVGSASLFTSLYFVGVVPQTYMWCVACAAVCIFVNFIWLAYRIKRSIDNGMNVSECRELYLKVFLIHGVVNLLLSIICDQIDTLTLNAFYTFMFLPYKLFCFGVLPFWASAIIMNGVMLLANYYFPAVPFWLDRIQKKPIKKNAIKMRKIKKIAVKPKKQSNKVKRRSVTFRKKGGKKR